MRKPDGDPRVVGEIAARLLPGPGRPAVERAEGGVSTQVYRLRRGATTLYLRIAEEREASLAPEVLVHELLRERGAKVPEVVHFEPFNEAIERSIMVTTEIAGGPIGQSPETVDRRRVLIEAGRDLAVINGLPVDGFGWIRREGPAATRLQAELPTHRSFALNDLDEHLEALRDRFLTGGETRAIRQVIADHDHWLDVDEAHLAHGDFDVTHIYQEGGRYTGIIDFGEIRGADRLYDLGHFALHDGETLPDLELPLLLEGYRHVAPLSADDERRIDLWGLLIGVRALARSAGRPRVTYQDHLARALRRVVSALRA